MDGARHFCTRGKGIRKEAPALLRLLDSHLFFVNDNSGSTDARCYVYEAASLEETDVAKVVLARYPDAGQFLSSGHSYLRAKRWLNSHELLVVLTGHNEGSPPNAFTLRYRIDLRGKVRKLSQHAEEQPK